MYVVRPSSKGYAIYFEEGTYREYISDNLSRKQAEKWCDRLNSAYKKGYASNW